MRGFWTGAEASGTAGGRQTSRDPGSPLEAFSAGDILQFRGPRQKVKTSVAEVQAGSYLGVVIRLC